MQLILKKHCCVSLQMKNQICFFLLLFMEFIIWKKNKKPTDFLSAIKEIEQDKFLKLKNIEKEIMLDYTLFVFFERCMNKFLAT